MRRVLAGLLLLWPRLCGQQSGIVVKDIFGRSLNQVGITLVDWDGYMANPAIRFTIVPPPGAKFPATATLSAGEPRLYFDLPSEAGPDGPRKAIDFPDATPVAVQLGNVPDRDSADGSFELHIQFTDGSGRISMLTLPIHEIDQDRETEVPHGAAADFSRDETGFFHSAENRAPVEQALADWSYFFDITGFDQIPAGREKTPIWKPGAFVSSETIVNQVPYRGVLIYAYGVHTAELRSGGEPSAQGQFQTFGNIALPLRRSGGVEIETAGNFNSLGWLTEIADSRWWVSSNLGRERNELLSIAHHESGHALAFNPAQPNFAKFKAHGCVNDRQVLVYHHGACPAIDRTDHFDGEVDDDSLFGAFGNEYHGRTPRHRWYITKLDLLAAQAVGWKLRLTSAFVPVSIATANLPPAIARHPYRFRFSALGGIPFYNWTIASGALPDGLNLDSFTGSIAGTPTRSGKFTFTLRLQDYHEGSPGRTRAFTMAVGSS